MELTTISYSHGLTINTGNYQSERIDVGATATLAIGDSISEEFAALVAIVKLRLEGERMKIRS